MTDVVAIEFCEEYFKTEKQCYEWILNSKYSELIRVTGFNLRRNGQAKLLTNEKKRSVHQWSQGLGTYSALRIERPESCVVVAISSGQRFAPTDLPAPLQKTIDKERKKAENHRIRVEAARARRVEEAKNRPPKVSKRKNATGKQSRKRKSAAAFLAELEDPYGIKVGRGEVQEI